MSVDTLKAEIEALPEPEYRSLRDWFAERDQDAWDAQIERDSASGALEFLKREAIEEVDARSVTDA